MFKSDGSLRKGAGYARLIDFTEHDCVGLVSNLATYLTKRQSSDW